MSSFCTPQLIATQCRYQLDLGNDMVALVIDSLDLSRGKLNLKAFRVNSRFVKLFDENKITADEFSLLWLASLPACKAASCPAATFSRR